ncbi:MAG: fimbrillin family protein [Tidjanibacter sp.]|nr:fimbrillin family protein [Tidjanibacter sp.]
MKFGKIFAMLAMVAVVATACQNEPEGITPDGSAREITVKGSLANFNRATDTAFEEGDQVGLHIITNEVYLNNALYTYTGGALVGVKTNYWYLDNELQSTVIGYYPYSSNAAYKNGSYTFTVNADQSNHEKYTLSDLMVATTTAKPTAEAIELPFKHAMSKVVITIDNQLADEEIDNVWFSEVYGSATLNLTDGSIVATGEKGTIKTAPVTINEKAAWAVILAPQTEVTPKLIVTTKSKKQYTYQLDGSVNFSSGKVSTANIVLKEDSIYTNFTPTISDWVADNELQFGQNPEEGGNTGDNEGGNTGGGDIATSGIVYLHTGVWNVDGAWFSAHFWDSTTSTDITMTDADGDGVFECGVPEGMTNVLFCRMNPAFTGFNWDVYEGETLIEDHVWNQTEDLTIGVEPNNHYYVTDWEKGTWNNSSYDPSTDLVGKDSGLGVVGSFAASNWAEDMLLYSTETTGVYVAKNIEFKTYEAFKIRTVGTWEGAVNLGSGDVNYFKANKYFSVFAGGGDIIVEAAGTYDIYFDQNNTRVYLMSAGTPYTSATEQTTNGAAPDVSTMKWGLVGVHNSWGTGDIPLVWDGTCGLYVAKSATLAGAFKVRADESWTTNFGSGGAVGVNNASATTVYNNGNNCSVTAGTYDVYFWYDSNNIKANGKLWVKSVGSAAPSL